MKLYEDKFCTIGMREDTERGYYSDISLTYFEFPAIVAEYISKRFEENIQHGSRLIDDIKAIMQK